MCLQCHLTPRPSQVRLTTAVYRPANQYVSSRCYISKLIQAIDLESLQDEILPSYILASNSSASYDSMMFLLTVISSKGSLPGD